MKCIRNMETFEIVRVSDERAIQLIRAGNFRYCKKQEWKEQKRGQERAAVQNFLNVVDVDELDQEEGCQ